MNIRIFFTKKKIIWAIVVLLAVFIGYRIFKPKNQAANIITDTVKKQNLKATVLATGQVVSGTDLDLSFKAGGIVSKVYVKEGDKVKAGQTLATLDQKDQAASLTQAQGALAQAEANYQKVLAGASSEDIAVAQTALDNAKLSLENTKNQQETAVKNAYSALLNSTITAVPQSGNVDSATVTVSGTYTGTDQGVYNVAIYSTGSNLKFNVTGLETALGDVRTVPVPLGTRGLFVLFSSTNMSTADAWAITIPNVQSAAYEINYNAYQAAVQNKQSAIDAAQAQVNSAQAALDLKKAQARPADVAAAQAQILSAQGQVQEAEAALSNGIISAPADGTITAVDIKVGEQATPSKEVLVLQDVGNLHIEANVSEANIASIQAGQSVDVTFDALGPDRHFVAKVQTVNPASTVVSGVVNYKVTATVGSISEIKPGMTANMTILTAEKDNALSVPSRAVISNGTQQYVRVINNDKMKTYHQVPVQIGLQADGGLVEIVSGLSEGQEIVSYIKQ